VVFKKDGLVFLPSRLSCFSLAYFAEFFFSVTSLRTSDAAILIFCRAFRSRVPAALAFNIVGIEKVFDDNHRIACF
jgi:hypothetical protein